MKTEQCPTRVDGQDAIGCSAFCFSLCRHIQMDCEPINDFLEKLDELGAQGISAGCASADDGFNQFTGEEPKNINREIV